MNECAKIIQIFSYLSKIHVFLIAQPYFQKQRNISMGLSCSPSQPVKGIYFLSKKIFIVWRKGLPDNFNVWKL